MLSQLTSAQLSEWEAYDRLDPIGSWRNDFNFAQISSIITNIVNSIYCGEGKTPVISSAAEFMPVWDKATRKQIEDKRNKDEIKRQSAEEMKNALITFANAHNKRIAVKSKPPVKLKS